MSKKQIETDVRVALDNASLEYITQIMEEVDPEEFNSYSKIAKKRVERKVMSKIISKGKKVNKSSFSVSRFVAAVAAIIVLALGAAMIFNADVRASVFNFFSFLPGKGFVEIEDSGMNGNPMDKDGMNTDVYTYNDRGQINTTDDISVEILSVVLSGGKLEIEYVVDMLKYDPLHIEKFTSVEGEDDIVISDEEYFEQTYNYYTELGYDNYFTLSKKASNNNNVIENVISKMKINGKNYKPVSSVTLFGEASGNKLADIKEVYDISDIKAQDIKESIIVVGDVETSFTIEAVKGYENMDEALKDKSVAKNDGITLTCDSSWNGDELKVTIYVADSGEYKKVCGFWPSASWDSENGRYPYIEVNGKKYEAFCDSAYAGEEVNASHLVFDMQGVSKDADMTLHIPCVEVIEDGEEITAKIAHEDYGTTNIGKTYKYDVADVSISEMMTLNKEDALVAKGEWEGSYFYSLPGDYVYMEMGIKLHDKSKAVFNGYAKVKIDNVEIEDVAYPDVSGVCFIPLHKSFMEANEITLSDPIYEISTDIQLSVGK